MNIIAKDSDGELYERGQAVHVCSTKSSLDVSGSATVSIFKSYDDGAMGGIAIKMTIDGPFFMPVVKVVEDGCEIHVAGEMEASAIITALNAALQMYLKS